MTTEDEDQGDGATQAFEAMRGELALLRRAVEGLAAERGAVDAPDYSETLGQLQRDMTIASENIARIGQGLAKSPALAMTPEQMAQRIAAAGSAARHEDQAALATAKQGLDDAARQLRGTVAAVRLESQQRRWLAWTAIGGIVAGAMLWATFGGALARATPDSWLWPERMAARMLGGSPWGGARRLAAAGAPERWNEMVAGAIIGQGNQAALERCQRAAVKAEKPVLCTVKISSK